MSDFPAVSRPGATADGMPAVEQGASSTMSHTAPQRPEAGSPLERLLSRQAIGSGAARLLGFVPAQVR